MSQKISNGSANVRFLVENEAFFQHFSSMFCLRYFFHAAFSVIFSFERCFCWIEPQTHLFVELSTNSMFLLISASNTFFRQFKQTNSFSVNLRETCQKKVKTLKKKVKSRKIGNWRTKKSVFKEAVKDKKNVIKKLLEEQKSVIKKSDRQKTTKNETKDQKP